MTLLSRIASGVSNLLTKARLFQKTDKPGVDEQSERLSKNKLASAEPSSPISNNQIYPTLDQLRLKATQLDERLYKIQELSVKKIKTALDVVALHLGSVHRVLATKK